MKLKTKIGKKLSGKIPAMGAEFYGEPESRWPGAVPSADIWLIYEFPQRTGVDHLLPAFFEWINIRSSNDYSRGGAARDGIRRFEENTGKSVDGGTMQWDDAMDTTPSHWDATKGCSRSSREYVTVQWTYSVN